MANAWLCGTGELPKRLQGRSCKLRPAVLRGQTPQLLPQLVLAASRQGFLLSQLPVVYFLLEVSYSARRNLKALADQGARTFLPAESSWHKLMSAVLPGRLCAKKLDPSKYY